MKTNWRMVFALVCVVMFAGLSFAGQHTQTTVLLPDGSNTVPGNELNTVWQDSIFYYVPGEYSGLMGGGGYWSGTIFTAPTNFTLQGLRFLALNQYSNTVDPCEVYVYTNDNGVPGDNVRDDGEPFFNATIPAFSDWQEVVFDEADYVDFEEGEEFWIIYGPAPGGAYPGSAGDGWWNLYDAAASGDRSFYTTGEIETGNWIGLSGDLFITANGEAESFFDLGVKSISNDLFKFHLTTDENPTFSIKVINNGNSDSPAATVEVVVEDEAGSELFTETLDVPVISGGDSTTVTCANAWDTLLDGRHVVTATVAAEGDASADNDSNYLLQSVVSVGDWYAYDDGTFEEASNFNEDSGWAVTFLPVLYPANVDSAAWYFNQEDTDVDLEVWNFDMTGGSMTQFWVSTEAVAEGWNYFDITDEENPNGYNVPSGEVVLFYVWSDGDNAFPCDGDQPISAQNQDMPEASYQVDNSTGDIFFDSSGNWGMRARIGAGVAPALSFSATAVDFGTTTPNVPATGSVEITNDGTGDGRVDSTLIGQVEITTTTALPLIIAPGTTETLEFQFLSATENPAFQGAAFVYVNDMNFPSMRQLVTFSAVVEASVRTNSEMPVEYSLSQNYPNPFNPTTEIKFGLRNAGHVNISVFNVMGQKVATLVDQEMTMGSHAVNFNASNLSSGVYYYSIQTPGFQDMKKMVLMK